MKVYILFIQREEQYPGQYAPEAIACMDEYGREENPDYMAGELEKAEKESQYAAAKIFEIDLGPGSQDYIRSRLLDPEKMEAKRIVEAG